MSAVVFAVEPHFDLSRYRAASPSSESSTEDDEAFALPFTTSPLDNYRGAKSAPPVRYAFRRRTARAKTHKKEVATTTATLQHHRSHGHMRASP
jgi:hypothetical protein